MSTPIREGPDALAGLLAYVAQVRDGRLATIRHAADEECGAVVGAARAKARAQVREALREARRDADARVAHVRAEAQARLRRARQAVTSGALATVRERVATAMRARWADAASRSAWLVLAFAEAGKYLPPGEWVVSHPASMAPLAQVLPDGVSLQWREDAAIAAGVRISFDGAQIDATLDGLLRGEDRVAALWLGEIERLRRTAGRVP